MKHLFSEIVVPIELDNKSIKKYPEKCIKCGQCKRTCENEIGVANFYNLEKTNDIAICINCGQCVQACPTGAISQVEDIDRVKEALKSKDKIVIFSTSPSVRVALGEEFKMKTGSYVEDKMVHALRNLGADYVFDIVFGADMTIMEEANELMKRIVEKNENIPQFTSCCPGWVTFVETFYPELLNNLSTAKSPISMQGATIKTYFAQKENIDPNKIVTVTVTPCTAKKFEISRPEMNDSAKFNNIEGLRDNDIIITTKELAKWLKEEGIDFTNLEGSEFDNLLGRGSGAGVIFGNSGGVTEAAIRTAYYLITGQDPTSELLNFEPVRGLDGVKESSITIGDITLKLAVVQGTANARTLIEKIKNNEVKYDFIEVMACKGGCIGGGGQPKTEIIITDETRTSRINSLYKKDGELKIKCSHQNPDVINIYAEFYKEPLSHLAHELLHTSYSSKKHMLGIDND